MIYQVVAEIVMHWIANPDHAGATPAHLSNLKGHGSLVIESLHRMLGTR